MNPALANLVLAGAEPMLLATDFNFTEGPAADANGNLYFVDIGNNRIHFWNVETQQLSTIRENSGGADGMFVDADGALWICEMVDKRISRITTDGDYAVMLDSYEGESFTGPNDLWIDAQGGIYFTDSYGGHGERGRETRFFYRSPEGDLSLLAADFYKSNGVQGTPDGRWIYVADYLDNKIYRYTIRQPGQLAERMLFAEVRCDGMAIDELGNLYLCNGNGGDGVVVVNPEGETIGSIELPENPHNICFGGPNFRTLYITATHGFYSLTMKVSGSLSGSPGRHFIDFGGLSSLVAPGAKVRQLATGFHIAQGPAALPNGDFYFADIFHDRILKWSFETESYTVIRENSGGGDGLAVMEDGSLLICELMGRRFGKLLPNGEYEIIADSYDGERLTGANDVLIDRHGGIYFSDSYTGKDEDATPTYCTYYIAPGTDELVRIVDDQYKGKGIQISPDEKWLYLADFGGRKVYRYDLFEPGVIGPKELFIDRMAGGMVLDEEGNIYISTIMDGSGVCIYNPDGEQIGQINVPDCTSNVKFAGPDFRTLIVTTFNSVYAIVMLSRGLRW